VATQNPARLVYGTIVVGALLAAEAAHEENYQKTIGSVIIALIVYWLAHTYADLVADRLESGARLTLKGVTKSAVSESAILLGAVPPLVVLIVFWIVGAELLAAINAAIYTIAGVMVLIEIVAGARSDLRGLELIGQVAFGVLLGLAVIALKILLH
jgi:hypothetical protein